MAVSELGTYELEAWQKDAARPAYQRYLSALWNFTRRKPLGAICGLIVIFFCLVGDLVPETLNKVTRTAGIADRPVPYFANFLEKHTSFIYPYAKQDLRARLQGPSGKHLLGTDSIGRDILSRLLYGARTAVMVAFGAVAISE